MRQKRALYTVPLVVFAAASISACATTSTGKSAYQPMSGPEIKQALSGNTLYKTGDSDGTRWEWAGYYLPNGTAHGRAWWSGGKKEGNAIWAVKGNSVCIHWNNDWDNGKKACFRMLRKGDVIISKAITKGATDSKLKLEPGDPYKL